MRSSRAPKVVAVPIEAEFYARDPAIVARELLGMDIVRVVDEEILVCRIVETEAYYGVEDPASRARRGGDLRDALYNGVGIAIVYGMHRQWLFNVAAHPLHAGGAVLIRACQPIKGVEKMMQLRGVSNPRNLTSGPGRLCRALAIDKRFHRKPIYVTTYGLWIEYGEPIQGNLAAQSHRVGVKQDLNKPLRFYIRNNPYVSKP